VNEVIALEKQGRVQAFGDRVGHAVAKIEFRGMAGEASINFVGEPRYAHVVKVEGNNGNGPTRQNKIERVVKRLVLKTA
jgi:hypothetical protein